MPRQQFKALVGLKEAIQEVDDSLRGRMAHVVESNGHMVRVQLPGEPSDGGPGWYPATVRHIDPGQVGVLLPLFGTSHLFIPIETNTPSYNHSLYEGVHMQFWLPGRYLGVPHYTGNVDPGSSAVFVADCTYAAPFVPPVDATIDAAACYVHAPTAGSQAIMAVYESKSTGFAHDQPITQTSAFSTATSGTKVVALQSHVTLKRNKFYWLAIVPSHDVTISRVVPSRHVLSYTNYIHVPSVGALRQNTEGFALISPGGAFTTTAPDIHLRRKVI